jgi:hypothetical protein
VEDEDSTEEDNSVPDPNAPAYVCDTSSSYSQKMIQTIHFLKKKPLHDPASVKEDRSTGTVSQTYVCWTNRNRVVKKSLMI